jgi:predicted enzyme related to lactoylglutathione lyase
MAGKLVHFEIPAGDSARGKKFWSDLFGWQYQSYEGPVEYNMISSEEQPGGAIFPSENGGAGILVYFDVDDIGAGAARVKELGGEAEDPGPVPGMGWYAQCKDSEGNRFGLWQTDPSAGGGSPEG